MSNRKFSLYLVEEDGDNKKSCATRWRQLFQDLSRSFGGCFCLHVSLFVIMPPLENVAAENMIFVLVFNIYTSIIIYTSKISMHIYSEILIVLFSFKTHMVSYLFHCTFHFALWTSGCFLGCEFNGIFFFSFFY